MAIDLDISVSQSGDWQVMSVGGEVDLASAPSLRRAIEEHTSDGANIVADLRKVTFMDSTGLRVLIAGHQALEESGGRMAIVPGDGPVARLLQLTGVVERLSVHESVEEATSS